MSFPTDHFTTQAYGILERLAALTGTELVSAVAREIAVTLGFESAMICALTDDRRSVEVCAFIRKGEAQPEFVYLLGGTPFAALLESPWTIVPEGIQEAHPGDPLFRDLDAEGVAAFRLESASGEAQGLLVLLSAGAMQIDDAPLRFLQTLARRTGLELATLAAARKLEREAAAGRHLVRHAPDLIARHAPDGTFIEVLGPVHELTGYRAEELIGRRPYDFFHPDDVDAVRDVHRRLTREPKADARPEVTAYRWLRKDGAPVHLESSSRAVLDETGALVEVVAFSRDVSRRHDRNAQLEADYQRLEGTCEMLESVIRAVPDPVFVKDANHRWIYGNPAFARWIGATPENFLGRSDPDFMEAAPADESWRLDAAAMERVEPIETEQRLELSGAAPRLVRVRRMPTKDEEGDPILIGVIRDLSGELESRGRAEEAECLLSTILNSTTDRICMKDVNHRFVLVNESYAKARNLRMDEIVGKDELELGTARDAVTKLWSDDEATILEGQVRSVYEDGVGAEGEARLFHTVKAPVLDPSGQPIGLLCYARDLTELRESQARQRKVEEELSEQRSRATFTSKMASLGEMAGGIAHEINNPLAVIHGNAAQLVSLAESGRLDSDRIKKSSVILLKTSERIARIVRSLRAFVRDGAQDPFETAWLRFILQDTLEFCVSRFRHHAIELRIGEIPETLEIECRSVQIAQVLLNLLNNSFDAVQEVPGAWVSVEVFDCGEQVEISVTDSGPGIPEAIVGRVMDPFFTTKPPGKGTGLGLSIASNIAREHEGSLEVDRSSPHTRFVIRLPKRRRVPASAQAA